MMNQRVSSAVVLLLLASNVVMAQEWSRFRGRNGTGVSDATTVPAEWTDKDLNWNVALPGIGHSSPIVHGDRVFVTTCLIKEQKRMLLCLDRKDGKLLWEREVAVSPLEPLHKLNSRSSSTPATDGKLVYVTFLRLRPKTNDDGPPLVVETSGEVAVLPQAADLTSAAVRVVVVGMSSGTVPVRPGVFPEKEIDVIGSSCATAEDFRAAINLVKANRASLTEIFTHHFPLTRAAEAFEFAMRRPPDAIKIVVTVN